MKAYIGPYQDSGLDRIIQIEVDPYDSWSADSTIAMIAVPILKQLKRTNHGYAEVKASDVPKNLRQALVGEACSDEAARKEMQARWEYVQDEIIWALDEIAKGKPTQDTFFEHPENIPKGLSVNERIKLIKIDQKGLKAYEKRLEEGCRLFGAYFMHLWD